MPGWGGWDSWIGEGCTWWQLSFSSRLAIDAAEAADLMLFIDCAFLGVCTLYPTASNTKGYDTNCFEILASTLKVSYFETIHVKIVFQFLIVGDVRK